MPDIRLQALPPCQLYRTRLDLGGESIYDLLGIDFDFAETPDADLPAIPLSSSGSIQRLGL